MYLGRGYNFLVALEGVLKLKAISYIHAEGYLVAEMKHGPIALIDEEIKFLAYHVIYLPAGALFIMPLLTVISLQLLSYYIATLCGGDVDRPRNLAKSVTVE